ncbi:peptidyl-prolyl cis-trans isomerase FKBP9 isoform X3 [Hypanus sabinus]|uniref:peptidyl-prolyl cis-trans isomerase FKBP9 isoform X3 n=1 Tax=Hypanus sabinus TaxID=79690 RepID=UPI0028C488A7|nr:peptidyl-prolyl cis-trans isomerase FKBP9 isoform X3 [Hypanus sabinus]
MAPFSSPRRQSRSCRAGLMMGGGMRLTLVVALLLGVAGKAPPVPVDDVVVEKRFEPRECLRAVQPGDFIRYHYLGTLAGGKGFDSSYDRGSTHNVFVGKGRLIAGMDKALIGMCVNERRFIKVPPDLAYGSEGLPDMIPPDATLFFDVLMLDIWNPEDKVKIDVHYKPENCNRIVQVSDFVRYHYNGTLLDGTLFDSSYSRNHTYDTYIGMGQVIAGMEEGLLGVCVGERRTIIIPPHLGYGEEGVSDSIPGSAVLVFHIHLVDVHNPSDKIEIKTNHKPRNCTARTKKGDYIKYHFNATLMDGTQIESTHIYGKTYNVVLGSGQVVIGMDMGLTGMCVEERRTIIVPPHLGYGEKGLAGEVPGSAVLVFNVELVELVTGLPEGYLFVWNEEVSPDVFQEIDKDGNNEISSEEFSKYIQAQVDNGRGKLAPGFSPDKIIENMFSNQDRNGDGKITIDEFKLKDQERSKHDEL